MDPVDSQGLSAPGTPGVPALRGWTTLPRGFFQPLGLPRTKAGRVAAPLGTPGQQGCCAPAPRPFGTRSPTGLCQNPTSSECSASRPAGGGDAPPRPAIEQPGRHIGGCWGADRRAGLRFASKPPSDSIPLFSQGMITESGDPANLRPPWPAFPHLASRIRASISRHRAAHRRLPGLHFRGSRTAIRSATPGQGPGDAIPWCAGFQRGHAHGPLWPTGSPRGLGESPRKADRPRRGRLGGHGGWEKPPWEPIGGDGGGAPVKNDGVTGAGAPVKNWGHRGHSPRDNTERSD